MSADLLTVTGLRLGYGRSDVIHGMSFRVPRGAIVSLVGANGAGKSTTLRGGRLSLRRRAADAGNRPGDDGQAGAALLDEPSMGLAPLIVEEIFRIILQIRSEGSTILLVEQNAHAALEISDYSYVIEGGKIALEGTGVEVAHNPAVMAAYLGV